MKPLTTLKSALGLLVVLCVGLRVLAALVAPALPLIVVLFVMVSLLVWLFFPTRRL